MRSILGTVVAGMLLLAGACSAETGPHSDSTGSLPSQPTSSAAGGDDDGLGETSDGDEGPEGAGDERQAGTVDVLLKLELAEFVVSISELTDLGAYEERHPLFDDETVPIKPWAISVEEVLWVNRHFEHESDAELAPSTDIRAIEPPFSSAVSLGALAVESSELADADTVIVGLRTLGSDDLLSVVSRSELAVLFVAVVEPDGGWRFPGLPESANAEEVLATLISMLGAADPFDALERYHSELARALAVGDEAFHEEVLRAVAAVHGSDEVPESAWEDLSPSERMLNIDQTPDDVLASLRGVGIEYVFDDDVLAADPATAGYISVHARLGIVSSFAVSVGSHTSLVIREPGETLKVYMGEHDGTETLIGEIPPFADASVAIVRIGSDGAGGLVATFDSVREPTDEELSLAQAFGVQPDGRITRDR